MSNKDNGGPAFPAVRSDLPHGMTIRDWFAGQAMQSFMGWALNQNIFEGYESASDCAAAYAKHAYSIADAMLEARNQ